MMTKFRPCSILVLFLVLLLVLPLGGTVVPAAAAPTEAASETASGHEVAKITEDWTMWDGITLPVSVYYPEDADPGEVFPAILVVHGWTMDKSMAEWAAEYYAAKGYVGVAFTARGWFGAGGEVGCMDPEHEMKDVSHIISLLEGDGRFPLLTDDKGAVAGITGASMGGCFSYLMAPRKDPRPGDPGDERIRAVVPMHGSFDLQFSLYPNDVLKLFWVSGLLGMTYMGELSGFMMNMLAISMDQRSDGWQKLQAILAAMWKLIPPVTSLSNDLPYVYGIAMERRVKDEWFARGWLKQRSARYWCDEEYDGVVEHPITAPMLILAGWNDDLFYANEGLMAYEYTEAPKRIIITNHGHLGCYPGPYPVEGLGSPESAWVLEQVDKWFDRFLKGIENGVEDEAPVAFYRDHAPGDYGEAGAYPVPGTEQVSYFLGGAGRDGRATLTTSGPTRAFGYNLLLNMGLTGSVSLPYFQDAPQLMGGEVMDMPRRLKLLEIPFTETDFTSEPLREDVTIMGPPRFEPYYQSSSVFAQLIPWLYEVTPDGEEILISRGFYEGHNYEGLADAGKVWKLMSPQSPVEMQACYHRFEAGSRIRLVVSTADLVTCWPSWGYSMILLHSRAGAASRVILPVVPDSY
ncbi:MAG: CocE/NonD family hydrolase [Actinomycetota bacterium]